jgi:hypothetical protein
MSLVNTINFLPTIFQTVPNSRFLGASMDQLATDAVNIPVNGYIGRTVAPTFKFSDNYVPESTKQRTNYQLEASVVVKNADKQIEFNAGYIDLINSISRYNGIANDHQRLFSAQSYSYDGHFDYDKFVNYYNYHWIPGGPAAVSVYANQTPYSAEYSVTRNTDIGGYVFSGLGLHPNLQLTLARGGTYTFDIDQNSEFWIQSQLGVTGTDSNVGTVSTRQVFGVTNNGTTSGKITFKVPLRTAQDFYINMPPKASVDAATTLHYNQIQGQLLSDFLTEFPQGFDGVNNQLQNKTFVFINNDQDDSLWTVGANTVQSPARTGVWKITLVPTGSDFTISIIPTIAIAPKQKVFISSGKQYAAAEFWLDNNYSYQPVPAITANKDYLYYQDSSNPEFCGVIKLVDNNSTPITITTDIIGSVGYTSPNGVVFTNGLKVLFDSSVLPSSYANNEFYVEGVGTSITLVPVAQLIVPEAFSEVLPTTADYITISRADANLNPWTRSNYWFHTDVINATAAYNNSTADFGPNIPGRRPIIEFEPNLRLINYGLQAKNSVTYIVLTPTDAFNTIEGQITASIDGHTLVNGDRIIFANDMDTTIRNEVWEVEIQNINNTNYVTLIETVDDPVQVGQNLLITSGVNAGSTFVFSGTSWDLCQVKTKVNQAPLFDLVDSNGFSFTNTTVYPNTTFAGTKFFGYPVVNGPTDSVLGFPLSYKNFNNIGDIVFTNYYDTDTFTYTLDQQTVTVNCNSGFLSKSSGLTEIARLNDWIVNTESTKQYQVFSKFMDGYVLPIEQSQALFPQGLTVAAGTYPFVQIDVLPNEQTLVPYVKVYLNNTSLTAGKDFSIVAYGAHTVVILYTTVNVNDKVDIFVFSDAVSSTAYYEIPDNLDINPLNENFTSITLGQLRTHYNTLLENTSDSSTGDIPVQDNYLKNRTGTLIQHNASLVYAMTFLNDPLVNFVDGLTLARKEYAKFKNKFLSLCASIPTLDYDDPAAGVDVILQNINALKNSSFPWYYSDMVPQGSSYNTITYTVVNVRQTQYEIDSIFDNTQLSNRAVIVYVNGVQKTVGVDYTFSLISPAIIFTNTFTVGDVIVIRDYANTDGNYIPETPTKLGLYPKTVPGIYVDNTYQTPVLVIRGHDGSITPAFNDFRDKYLLELETRIYNNIKVDYTKNEIKLDEVIPGRFKTTDYSLTEYNEILSQNFLNWVGANNVDYSSNPGFDINNSWTWNYSQFQDIVDGSMLQGSWRAIYQYWFGTDTPNLTPWEMLGFSSIPSWWATRYGPAPYTSSNAVLWEDLEAGYIYNGSNAAAYNDSNFARPGLTGFIPVDTSGDLLSPTQIPLIKQYNTQLANAAFAFGQAGPAETAWRRSSDFPYAIQLLLALTKPARYFSTQLDTSRFSTNSDTGQWSNIENQKISPSLLVVNGDTTTGSVKRTSGYINWIADNIKNLGIDPVAKIDEYFKNLSVQLNYKVGGFTDKKMLTVSAEQTSPGSTGGTVVIPDTNYNIYLNKSVPVATATYSAVIVERTNSGYSVSGYDNVNPFFTIIPSVANKNSQTIKVDNLAVQLYQDSTGVSQAVPYGTEYATIQQVADFLVSYERNLVAQGFVFTEFNTDLSAQQNWTLSVQELMHWGQQGWSAGTIILLNPAATQLRLQSNGSVVDEITNVSNGNKILNQNFLPIKSNNFNILRTENLLPGNQFQISTLDGSTICFARLNLVQYEHVLVFDNLSDFGDIIYIPNQGTRQYRLKLSGNKTGAWTGALSAPGYIYSDPVIPTWEANTDYQLGDIVMYNNAYYTASQNIPATATFSWVSWTPINASDIQTGLLPSFGALAQRFENIYDIDIPPSDEEMQLFSAGLIGFRQRQFMTDLGIGIPTQTKFYQGYIKEKGSLNVINALTKGNFNNVTGNINIFEEWAFLNGQYGGVDSNTFREFILDQSVFNTNPVAFTLTDNYDISNNIANLTLANIYNGSNVSNTSTSIYSNRAVDRVATDLPTAGYVNLADADYTVFDINNFTSSITNMGAGNKVWIAKSANNQWDILRVNETTLYATSLTYVLDSYAQLEFNNAHTFVAGDALVLKYFNPTFDGFYEVVDVTDPTIVTIKISDVQPTIYAISPLQTLIRALVINGTGTVYKLDSARVDTVTDIIDVTPPIDGWISNDRIWVNNATAEGWGVYIFNAPWLNNAVANVAHTITSNAKFGSAVRVSTDSNYVFVGSPGNKQVYANAITTSSPAVISVADTNFGSAIDSQGNILAITSSSNVYLYRQDGNVISTLQTITSANLVGNVTSISMSADQTWLYVGGNNVVHAYSANTTPSSANVHYVWQAKITSTGSFGNVIKTNSNGTTLFVGAPTANNASTQSGNVYVYSRSANAFTLSQTLSSQFQNDFANFGTGLAIDATAGNVYISAPGSTVEGFANGVVERWVLNGGVYTRNQTITHPYKEVGQFGVGISVSNDAKVLAIGSTGSPSQEHTTFDHNNLRIDSNTTKFVDHIFDSGATYIFEPLIDQTIANSVGSYVFVQELEAPLHNGDAFGSAVDVTRGTIAVGAPGALNTAGTVYTFNNPSQLTGWNLTRYKQNIVDIDSISRTLVYRKSDNNILAALDYIDPNKGKVLNSVAIDIDYQLDSDPALYNNGTGTIYVDQNWGPSQVGTIWWNLDTVRYIDYEQDDLNYRLNHWGELFPGSSIDVYEWVESAVLPSKYTGSGKPLHTDDSAYSTYGYVDSSGTVKVKYYFWVAMLDTVNISAGKQNSVYSIAAAIENPLAQGVPYSTVLRDDTVALYNVNQLLVGKDSIVQLGSQLGTSTLVHSEYSLVQENNPQSQIPANILNKFVDSLAGVDRIGNAVPDTTLPVSQRYGIAIRPRQSMFINQELALSNYLLIVNNYLQAYPVVERKVLTTLNSSDPVPVVDTGLFDITVDTVEELQYIDLTNLSAGYAVLVLSDSTNAGKWAIYTLNNNNVFALTSVQRYKTNLYWAYTDWYDASYNPTSTTDITVANNLEFGKLTLTANTYVKILDAGNGRFIVYYIDNNLNKNLVGIEKGTIQISTETIPGIELRQILLAMQNEIFIDDLAIQYNSIFFTMIKYILTEQKNLDWVFKTSFISATQNIRKLEQFPSYIPDNQDFYLDYINEVKPYRTLVREFVVDYVGNDSYSGDITDFDLPPYWDANLNVYRSPDGTQTYDTTIQSTGVDSQWFNNYTYKVVSVTVETPGTGFLFPPQITITGGNGSGATADSVLNSTGGIDHIVVTNPGDGYTTTPTIIINGVGTGASARAVLKNVYDGNSNGHNLVRSIKTNMKFDRINYSSANTFIFWDTITTANVGQTLPGNTIIVLNNNIFTLNNNYIIDANVSFPVTNTTQINISSFNNANDRIASFSGNVDFKLIDDGIDYPGVIVNGNTFIGNIYDTSISSFYGNTFGISPSEILVDGGEYVGTYSSHAPEELVPGRMFDSLNLTVYDRDQLSFRFFDDMLETRQYYRIAESNITTLVNDLHLTDTLIYVENASKLPTPNPIGAIPGVVFINGEKITYYTIDLVANTLGQIRRAVDGTSPQLVHPAESLVVDSSIQQTIPGTSLSNVSLTSSATYQTTDIVTLGIDLTSNISANVGDIITQTQTVDPWTDANYSTGSYVFYNGNTYVTTGNIDHPTSPWVANTTFSANSYISNSGNTYIVKGNVNAPFFANITSNVSLVSDVYDTKFGNIIASGNVTLEFAGNIKTQVAMRLLENVNNTNHFAAIVTSGALAGLPEVFDEALGFDVLQFDDTVSTISINGGPTVAYVNYSYILGEVTITGTYTLGSGNTVQTGHAWYTPGAGVPSNGQGLINSNTVQANFLKASRGYTP